MVYNIKFLITQKINTLYYGLDLANLKNILQFYLLDIYKQKL